MRSLTCSESCFERFECFFLCKKFLSTIRDLFLHFQLTIRNDFESACNLNFLETTFFASKLFFLETYRLIS